MLIEFILDMSCKLFFMRLHTSLLYKTNKKNILSFHYLIPVAINCDGRLKLDPRKDLDSLRCMLQPLNFKCFIPESSVLGFGSLVVHVERCFSTESISHGADQGHTHFEWEMQSLTLLSFKSCQPPACVYVLGFQSRESSPKDRDLLLFFSKQLEKMCLRFIFKA